MVWGPQESFERAKAWVTELQRQGNPNIVIALAGNKTDLSIKRKVQAEDAEAYTKEAGIMFMETSAKTASNVNELFVAIGTLAPLPPSNVWKKLRLMLMLLPPSAPDADRASVGWLQRGHCRRTRRRRVGRG